MTDKMTDTFDVELDKLLDEKSEAERKLQELINEKGTTILASMFRKLFDNSKIHIVRWTQYAPYFNDGEPCMFSVHEPSLVPEGIDPDEEETPDGESFDWYDFEAYTYNKNHWRWKEKPVPAYVSESQDAIDAFMTKFNQLEDVLEAIFGTDAQIRVSMDSEGGIVFETDSYDHD